MAEAAEIREYMRSTEQRAVLDSPGVVQGSGRRQWGWVVVSVCGGTVRGNAGRRGLAATMAVDGRIDNRRHEA
ncbi:hypothetical protein Nepgr_018785 [Nepenthes gracilis]|uniref:Uncharacterized protein n=1 Tax=Nepenthes gracilis TaxID=150966 RepID=A0AAD3SU09_NEPGR|nr:hypothetical protein Nepgr_018785 [Nepenthes gracilis]